ncbi:MAG: response regulator [Candidatus Omnitrophota bacterium]
MRPKLNLLILEDNSDDILILKEMLADIQTENPNEPGFELAIYSTLKEGITHLSTQRPDLIILDLTLPDSSRLNTLQTLRKIETARDIPIIVLTVLDDKESSIQAVKMGAQEYLVKSQVTAPFLFKAIRYALERHQLKLQLEKETEDLKKSEEQLIKIITGDPDGMIIVDEDKHIRFINPAAEKLLDRTRKEAMGGEFRFPLPENESTRTEIELYHKGGVIVTAEMRHVILHWQSKKAWLISLRDISRKKRLIHAFSEKKEKVDVTLRSIADGVIAADTKGMVTVINGAACRMIGWEQDRAIGKPIADVLTLNDPTGRSPIPHDAGDWVLTDREGRRIPVEFSCAPIRKQEEVMGSVWVIRDVSEKRELEAESIRQHNLDALGSMIGDIVHEYNNILTAALGYISLAQLSVDPNDSLLFKLMEIESSAQKTKDISERLFSFSGKGEPFKETGSVLQTLETAAAAILKYNQSRVDWRVPADLWPARYNPDQMAIALKNILKNAVEAMSASETAIAITTENTEIPSDKYPGVKRGKYIQIEITDQGTGMPPDIQEKSFLPFFTTKENAEGLGLTTAYAIIRRHGGWVRLKSTGIPGDGCTVSMLIPAILPEEDRLPVNVPLREPDPPTRVKGKVLIMDDEEFIREIAKELFETLGYAAASVENGEDVLDAYRQAMESGNPFTFVVLDMFIPGRMGGKECIKELLALDPNAKAVISSGYLNDPAMIDYPHYGFCGALPKPYLIKDLKGLLEKIVPPF